MVLIGIPADVKVSAKNGNSSPLSSYMILDFSFGITLLGWFSVALELLSIVVVATVFHEPNKSTNRLMKYNKQQKDWPNFFLKVSLTVNYSDFGACFLRVKTRPELLTFFTVIRW